MNLLHWKKIFLKPGVLKGKFLFVKTKFVAAGQNCLVKSMVRLMPIITEKSSPVGEP